MRSGRTGWFHLRARWSLALALSCAFHGVPAHADACSPESVGVDTAQADSYCFFFMGGACGQVFEARETVLAAVSVWREPPPNDTPLRLYILAVDSTGTPDDTRILLYGPTVEIIGGDGLRPARYRFVLDPPLVLPGPGHYEFAVQEADPDCYAGASLVADDRDRYPEGAAWIHARTYPDCYLKHARATTPGLDLIFEVEFCATTVGVPSALSALPFQMLFFIGFTYVAFLSLFQGRLTAR